VIVLVSDPDGEEGADIGLLGDVPANAARVVVHNKIDLADRAPHRERRTEEVHIWLSAKTGAGIDLLQAELRQLAGGDGTEGAWTARARHVAALERARTHLDEAESALIERNAGELAAEELREVQHALGEITGEFTTDELLGAIFSSFCIGK